MKKTYCPERGCLIEYGEQRPKWCPNCGSSMLNNTTSSAPAPIRRPQYQQSQDWEDEIVKSDFDLDPSSIRIRVAASPPSSVKAEEVVGTGSTGFGSRQKMKAKDYKEFEKKMRQEKPDPIEI